jgi:dihydrofolate reductase
MRKLIATVFNYSLDGLLADEGTEFWKFCFDLPENREPNDPAQLDFLQSAYPHIMGRTAYESIAGSMTPDSDRNFTEVGEPKRPALARKRAPTALGTDQLASEFLGETREGPASRALPSNAVRSSYATRTRSL